MQFLEVFALKLSDLDEYTVSQIRQLADRADTLVSAANRAAAELEGS